MQPGPDVTPYYRQDRSQRVLPSVTGCLAALPLVRSLQPRYPHQFYRSNLRGSGWFALRGTLTAFTTLD